MPNSSFLKIIFLLAALRLIAVILFCRGYLLSRRELPTRSQCSDFARITNWNNSGGDSCWRKQSYDRFIFLVIDGLRFDCVIDEDCKKGKKRLPHIGQFPKLLQLHQQGGPASLLFKFIADPPTSTTTRLKGLMTGALPTLFDVGNTFSGKEVTEDNLLSQLSSQHRQTVFVGDDTWEALFSKQLAISIPYPSFDVHDLDTVDDGVRQNFYPLVFEKSHSWDVAIGHYLGVDHAGHVFTVPSNQTATKLQTMDDDVSLFVENLVKNERFVNEKTLLLVFGDHAMTLKGEHGSGSKEEVETVLLAFDIHQMQTQVQKRTEKLTHSYCAQDFNIHRMDQIDFAATLATLMDIPIPYGSIGSISRKLFEIQSHNEDILEDLILALKANAWQIYRYLNDYSQVASPSFRRNLKNINELYEQTKMTNESLDTFDVFVKEASSFAKVHWTRFDDVSILAGLSLFFLTLPLQVYLQKIPWKNKELLIVPHGIILLHGLGFFSDSFINAESYATSFFFVTLNVWLIWKSLRSDAVSRESSNEISLEYFLILCFFAFCFAIIEAGSSSKIDGLSNSWSYYSGRIGSLCSICALGLMFVLQLLSLENLHYFQKHEKLVHIYLCLSLLQVAAVIAYSIFDLLDFSQTWTAISLAQFVYWSSLLALLFMILCRIFVSTDSIILPSRCLIVNLLPSVLLVCRKILGFLVILSFQCCEYSSAVLLRSPQNMDRFPVWYFLGILYHYVASKIFYDTGHYCKFSGLDFTAGFIGFPDFNFYTSGMLLILDTFAGYIISLFFIFLQPQEKNHNRIHSLLSGFQIVRNYFLFMGMLSGNIMRRHLFSVETFAPKMLFELSFSLISESLLLFLSMFLMKVE